MKTHSTIEPLEPRIAPATLVGNVLTYTDLDGDLVKVTFTKAAMIEANFSFSTGTANDGVDTPRSLDQINLMGKTGAGLTVVATPKAGKGDSHANIGSIDGSNTDLGAIRVDGNVAELFAGTGVAGTVGLKSFTALSLGLPTAAFTSGTFGLKNVGTFTIKGNLDNAEVGITGGVRALTVGGHLQGYGSGGGSSFNITGDVGTLKIGGSILTNNGTLPSLGITGNVGTLRIGGSVSGGVGDITGNRSQVEITGFVKTLTIGGDLRGGEGDNTGSVKIGGTLGTAKIGGSLLGGAGQSSARFFVVGQAGSVTIGGSIVGFAGTGGGVIGFDAGELVVGDIGAIKIAGSVLGGQNSESGTILALGNVKSIVIGRDLRGADYSGGGIITISGAIIGQKNIGSISIGGAFIAGRATGGGGYVSSGMIGAFGIIGAVKIGGSISGDPTHLAYITAGAKDTTGAVNAIASITVKGSVQSASLLAGYDYNLAVRNIDSGIGSVAMGGSLIGSHIIVGSSKGLDGQPGNSDDGAISTVATIGSVKIGGAFTGLVSNPNTFFIYGPVVKKLTVGKANYNQTQMHTGNGVEFFTLGKANAYSTT